MPEPSVIIDQQYFKIKPKDKNIHGPWP